MKALVTGGAGCIGAELIHRLAARGDRVVALDNLSSGRYEHIADLLEGRTVEFIEADVLGSPGQLDRAMAGVDVVWHLAANGDVKYHPGDPANRDLEQNLLGTFNVLESMRRSGARRLVFASTSAIYGLNDGSPISEEQAAAPVSLYGASKAGSEALIRAFQNLFDMRCAILRFANIVGARTRRSGQTVIPDFIRKLRANPAELHVLGNGLQAKSYLHCAECVDAMLFVEENAPEAMAVYNLGPDDSITVRRIAELVAEAMGLANVRYIYGETETGWPGDVPRFLLDSGKLNRLGWRAKLNSAGAVRAAIDAMLGGANHCRQ